MKVLQTGGYVLETEEAFFDWLKKDSNIEDLLKSTLQFMEYKSKVATMLVKSTMDELDQYWKTKLMARIQTRKTVDKSLETALKTIRLDALSQDIAAQKYSYQSNVYELSRLAGSIQTTAEREGQEEEAKYLSRLSAQINQVQNLKGLYDTRKKEICSQVFAKKGEEYKKALEAKRASIREKVNQFIESFTGESNRRHRLYILNYAIDFAQNWTSFQGNYKLNLLITGGAGLGKTTFAKAIGKLFYEFGFLARDLFQIREKTDFIGQYVGWTPMKTYSTLYSGLESMIFIDEAYSVSGCGTGSKYDYGQEFIDALVDVSQKTRGLLSIVAAGYKSEIHNCFLDKNPGMRRRFPNELELTPYSSIDLDNILTNNVLRPVFETQLNSVLKMDLLKEPEIYFQNPTKFQEFGKEIFLRLPELGGAEDPMYRGLLEDAKRSETLQKIASTKITNYPLILRYRTKIIGLYRFFMQLASFDTNFPSFEAMYSAHQFLWKMVTENNPSRSYKYNNYRLMHIIYLSSHQQRREIMKSFLLRKYYSEKEGSLFPNQAGDMDTLAAFIKSQPNIRLNVTPTFDEVIKLYNEYFRSRGGSKFSLKATKTGDAIELLIYHIGGGFINYSDFEESVLTKIFKSLTFDGETISALWNLNAQTEEHRKTIVRNVNSFYSNACVTLLMEAQESLKTSDSNEKNEKRLPSGIDIRFLEAEAMSFLSANQGAEMGDETKKKFLDYVSFGDLETNDEEMKGILNEITADSEEVEAPRSLTLDQGVLCKDFGVEAKPTRPEDMPPGPPTLEESDAVDLGGPPVARTGAVAGVPRDPTGFQEALDMLKELEKRRKGVVSKPSAKPAPAQPAPPPPAPAPVTLPPPPPTNPPIENLQFPLKLLRVFIKPYGRAPANFLKMPTLIETTRLVEGREIKEEYRINPYPLPHRIPEDATRKALVSEGYYFFLVEWIKGEGADTYRGQGFVYILKESKRCSNVVPLLKQPSVSPQKFYQFRYLGRLDEIYPNLSARTLGTRTFTVGSRPTGPLPPPPGVPSLTQTKVPEPDKELKTELDKIYPPTKLEFATYKTKLRESKDAAKAWIQMYRKTKAIEYARNNQLSLKEPLLLYYHTPAIQTFDELVGKELSFAREYPELFVAKITEADTSDGEVVTTENNHYRIYKVTYLFLENDLMKSDVVYYGLKLPSPTATPNDLKYPLQFVVLETEDDEDEKGEGEEDEDGDEDEDEDEEENIGNVEFVAANPLRATSSENEPLTGAMADLNQLVGTKPNNES